MVAYNLVPHSKIELESNDELAKQFKKFKSSPKYNHNSQELFCICRKPDVEGQLMVGCDGCDEWFHFKCMGINVLYKNLIASFYCKFCHWKGKGITKWKRKCRVDTCWNGCDDSKYCSRQCGLDFMKSVIQFDEVDKLKMVIDKYDHQGFKVLGDEFPELEEVKRFEDNLNGFPDHLKADLILVRDKLSRCSDAVEGFRKKVELLAKYRELMKPLNEKATALSSKKKVELCFYNRELRQIDEEKISGFEARSQEIIDKYSLGDTVEGICINDRRRCLRHNGWLILIQDEFMRNISELEVEVLLLQEQQKLLLREHSISVYESIA